MDAALPAEDQVAIQEVLESYRQAGVKFHALRTRQAGTRKFISLHVLVPGDWTVQRGHQLLERIEMTFAMCCWTRRSSHILNHWMIRLHGTMKPSIEASMRQSQRTQRRVRRGWAPTSKEPVHSTNQDSP